VDPTAIIAIRHLCDAGTIDKLETLLVVSSDPRYADTPAFVVVSIVEQPTVFRDLTHECAGWRVLVAVRNGATITRFYQTAAMCVHVRSDDNILSAGSKSHCFDQFVGPVVDEESTLLHNLRDFNECAAGISPQIRGRTPPVDNSLQRPRTARTICVEVGALHVTS